MKLVNEEEIKELSRLHTVEEFKEFLKKKTEDLSEEDLEMADGGIGEMNDAMKSYANIVIRSCKDSGMIMEDCLNHLNGRNDFHIGDYIRENWDKL